MPEVAEVLKRVREEECCEEDEAMTSKEKGKSLQGEGGEEKEAVMLARTRW